MSHVDGVSLTRYFGNAVREQRKKLNLSQELLATRAGLHRTYVTDIESGKRNVTLVSVAKLAAALEVSVASLMPDVCPTRDTLSFQIQQHK